ncbi:hypothetical protein RB195_000539 [Necator americanus]|uniref:Uncharacterized protein n=1 Tax=Necator americanus TaxID=51031 RepID=A0ABR1DA92_NECAM
MHPTVCILGCCCTKPTTPTATTTPVDVNAFGYCYNGERSQMRCSSTSVCSSGQTCINGLCCKTTGEEWQNACAGLAALASCTNGTCGEFICTTSNYCCECQFGRTSGLCSKGCGPGFTCSPNNYCCPSCPSVDANKVHWSIVLAGAICILLAVYAGSKDQLLPLDNYGTQKGWFLRQRSKFTNSTLFLSEVTEAQKKTHPLHKLHKKKLIRYDFGTSFANHCKLKVKPNGSLPSLARVLEMKIASQVLLRLAVLLGFNIKFVLCMIRNQSILILSGRRFLCRLQPVIELLSSVVLVLMTCLHQEQDQSVKWLMPYNFPMFSCLFILGGIMYLNLDVIDLSKKLNAAPIIQEVESGWADAEFEI